MTGKTGMPMTGTRRLASLAVVAAALVLAGVWAASAVAAPAKPPAKKPAAGKKPDEKAAPVEVKPLDPLVALGGPAAQAGPPAFLRYSPNVLVGLDGVSKGEVKTADADFAGKDFVFDVVMNFVGDDGEFVFGVGENGRDSNWIVNSVAIRWSGRSGYCDLVQANKDSGSFTRAEPKGTHLLRMEKKGEDLTFTVASRTADADPFKTVASKTLANFKKKADFLTDKNATLFFGGGGTVKAVALSVNGKTVEPGKPALDPKSLADAAAAVDKVPLTPLGGAAGLPSWLRVGHKVLADADGLHNGEVRTTAQDLVEHDFVLDVLF